MLRRYVQDVRDPYGKFINMLKTLPLAVKKSLLCSSFLALWLVILPQIGKQNNMMHLDSCFSFLRHSLFGSD